MTATLLEAGSWLAVVLGGLFLLVGGLGIVRLPEFFTRLHAAGVTDTMGAGLMLLGLALQADTGLAVVKLALILVFLLVTSPTAAHALAKAALHGGLQPRAEKEDAS